MRPNMKAIPRFTLYLMIGIICLAAFDALFLFKYDRKLAHDPLHLFMGELTDGFLLAVGATISVSVFAILFHQIVGRSNVLFSLLAALVALVFLATKAYIPLLQWIGPMLPRSVLMPIGVAVAIGMFGAFVALVGCVIFEAIKGRSSSG